jgi:hypothetical protein
LRVEAAMSLLAGREGEINTYLPYPGRGSCYESHMIRHPSFLMLDWMLGDSRSRLSFFVVVVQVSCCFVAVVSLSV